MIKDKEEKLIFILIFRLKMIIIQLLNIIKQILIKFGVIVRRIIAFETDVENVSNSINSFISLMRVNPENFFNILLKIFLKIKNYFSAIMTFRFIRYHMIILNHIFGTWKTYSSMATRVENSVCHFF